MCLDTAHSSRPSVQRGACRGSLGWQMQNMMYKEMLEKLGFNKKKRGLRRDVISIPNYP